MLRRILQPTGNRHRLRHGCFSSQVKLARVTDLPAHNEVRFLEILQLYIDHWIVQNLAVRNSQQIGNLRQRQTLHVNVLNAAQGDESIRVDRHYLIEFRSKRKTQLQHIRRMKLVAIIAVLQGRNLPVLVAALHCTNVRARDARRSLAAKRTLLRLGSVRRQNS